MEAAIIGTGQSIYTRRPQPGFETRHFIRDAVLAALEDCQIDASDVDGLAVSSFSLLPDTAIDLAWQLGLRLKWLLQDPNGGVAGVNMLNHAIRAVGTGAARCILICAGDSIGNERHAKVTRNFNRVTRDHLTPLGHGGANGVYSLVTLRQMKKYGLEKSDYGHIAISQRKSAALNPFAMYREPMSMEQYLSAPQIAGPLCRFDCPPVVAGAQAIVVTQPKNAPAHKPFVRTLAIATSFNHDNQQGDGLATGIATFAGDLWRTSGLHPNDIDLFSIYDDYPAMLLAQVNDLGLIPGQDLKRFVSDEIGERRIVINSHGGMLSAGQPGGPAGGLHGLAEAVCQLMGRAGERQVDGARRALVTGYGMTMYRYGGAAAAAVLERVR
jgi:acetyl-CoA acetyltransferase